MRLHLQKRPCEFSNHTFAVIDVGAKFYLSIQNEREIVGCLGKCLDNLLCPLRKRKCKLKSHDEMGVKLPNGSYTGMLGLLQNNQADMLLKPEPDYLDEPFLRKSMTIRTEEVIAFHTISDQKHVQYFNLIENFNLGYTFYLGNLLFYLLICMISLGISGLKMGPKKCYSNKTIWRKLTILVKYLRNKKAWSFKLILLFFSLFFWLNELFVGNNIKTLKIVVDKSELIKNSDELLETETKSVCFFDKNTEMLIAIHSRDGSILSRLFHEKSYFRTDQVQEKLILKRENCLLSHKVKVDYLENIVNSKFTFITSEIETFSEVGIKKIWKLTNGIQSYNTVFYYNLRNKVNEHLANTIDSQYVEFGLIEKVYRCLESNSEILYEKNLKVYKDLDDYVEDNTGFSDLVLKNFRTIFLAYFLICSSYLLVFIITKICNFKILMLKLNNCCTIRIKKLLIFD